MKNMKKILFFILVMAHFQASAQKCNSNMTRSYSDDQFLINGQTVTDITTGLMWMRCSVGQTLIDNNCSGPAEKFSTWKTALDGVIKNKTMASFSDWRLPNIKELDTIVERACAEPAISLVVFPDTPSAIYWTSTPHKDSEYLARIIDFSDGLEFLRTSVTERHIRLVRDIKASDR